VHLSTTHVNVQLEAKLFYFIILLLQSYTSFDKHRPHHRKVKFY